VLFAGRAIVAVDGVLGDDGAEVLEQVLDGPRACAAAALKFSAAAGAAFETVLLALVDPMRRWPPCGCVAGLGARLAFAFGAGGLA